MLTKCKTHLLNSQKKLQDASSRNNYLVFP